MVTYSFTRPIATLFVTRGQSVRLVCPPVLVPIRFRTISLKPGQAILVICNGRRVFVSCGPVRRIIRTVVLSHRERLTVKCL
ncbi:hypothetical protein LSG31_20560 [Fodinisporobacter ferrooxydans]|uniref:Uncharacterized protein n=1 Tax=Fodinisporobacter ferrooxydans TaxID=2901836 RepID=A0ABY4CI72_9BACL|nr:hypothetical protein LSG31_20560 [Alicyclobacillaceae bacterium MYW30-H2]